MGDDTGHNTNVSQSQVMLAPLNRDNLVKHNKHVSSLIGLKMYRSRMIRAVLIQGSTHLMAFMRWMITTDITEERL